MSRLTFEQVRNDLADLGEVIRYKDAFVFLTYIMGQPRYYYKIGFTRSGRGKCVKGLTLQELVTWAENRRRMLAEEANKQVEPPKTIRTKPLLSRKAMAQRLEGQNLPMWMLDAGDVIELVGGDSIYYLSPITILILPRKWGENWYFVGQDGYGERTFSFPDATRWNIIGKTTEPLPHDPTLLVRR